MWFAVDCDIGNNKKIGKLAAHLAEFANKRGTVREQCAVRARDFDDAAVAGVVRLLAMLHDQAPDGFIGDVSDDLLERWAQWKGEPGDFASGFLMFFVSDGIVTGWTERNGRLLSKRKAAAERMSANRSRTVREHPANSASTDQECSASTVTETVTETVKASSLPARVTTFASARAEIESRLSAMSLKRFRAKCGGWVEGMDLASGLRATEADIELACADWLDNNGTQQPTALPFRAYVERNIRRRLAAAATPPVPVSGFQRPNGKVTNAEQGFINATIGANLNPFADLKDEK